MRRLWIRVRYDGAPFVGWQLQPNGLSVQAVLEAAIDSLTGVASRVHGSGRTDAGVHAFSQSAHFDTESDIPDEKLPLALNAHLPDTVAVLEAVTVDDSFHARFSAIGKHYRYRMWNSRVRDPLERERAAWQPARLDRAVMYEAASIFEGTHDFRSLVSESATQEDCVRTIDRCRLKEEGELLQLDVVGNGFMYNMVRTLVGTLVQVGLGNLTVDGAREVLGSRDRSKAGEVVPACGLYLMKVFYATAEYETAVKELK